MNSEFDVDINVKDMYSFLMNNTYRKFSGILWVIMGIAAVVLAVYTRGKVNVSYTVLLLVFAVIFLVLNPVVLYLKARRQIKNNAYFAIPLHFTLDEDKITVSQGENSQSVTWQEIYKAVKYSSNVIIYITDIRTFIWPKRCLDNAKVYNDVVKLASAGLGSRCKLKEISND